MSDPPLLPDSSAFGRCSGFEGPNGFSSAPGLSPACNLTRVIMMKAPISKSWKSLLENNDAATLWQALHRLVSMHPLVRSAQRSQHGPTHPTPLFSLSDLTQDLYLLLLEKSRFDHYLQCEMADAEIEREIFQIELTNLLIGRLRRRRPENYRMVRRVSQVLETHALFRAFDAKDGGPRHKRYRQSAGTMYGLREWSENKPIKDSGTFTRLIASVPARMRNRRRVGCRGEAQVIITNQELVGLMEEILRAIDSPAPLRVLRSLALTKLPVYDASMISIEEEVMEEREGRKRHETFACADASPEQMALSREQEQMARRAAGEFLERIHRLTRARRQRTERLWRVLWHCYFDPAEPSQLAVAELVGISDSSVSDYRRKIEGEMRKLGFVPDQLRFFAEELGEQLRLRLATLEADAMPAEIAFPPTWPQYNYGSLAAFERLAVA